MESSKTSSIGKLAIIFLALFILCILLAYDASAALTDDIVLHYDFESDASDQTSNGNDASVSGATQTTGIIGNSYWFDGVNDKIYTDNNLPLTTAKSISFWVNASAHDGELFHFINAGSITANQIRGGAANITYYAHDSVGGSNDVTLAVRTGIMDSSWHHVVFTWSGADINSQTVTQYVDGVQVINKTAYKGIASPTIMNIGLRSDDGYDFTGNIDEVSIWNRSVAAEEVLEIYNYESTGTGYPYIGAGNTTNIYLTARDDFNASSILSFSVNVTWNNGSTTEHATTNGTVTFLNVSQTNTTINLTYWNVTDYFPIVYNNVDITANTSNSQQASMYQAVASLTITEKITNNSLSEVTFYIGSKSGSAFNISAGTHSVTAVKAGYYNLTGSITVPALSNTTYNLEGMYNAIANFTAYNALTNNSVSAFTVYLDIGENLTTTNGSASTGVINNTNYTFNITGSGFTSRYNLSYSINTTPQIINTSLYTFNSVRINIFNESSMSYLLQSVTVHTISNLTTFSNITSTGFILIDLLQPNTYEIRFESNNFNPRSIFLTVSNDSTQNISVYMTENETTELQIIEVLNTANQPLEGAVVWLQKEKLNQTPQWVTIQEAQTDYAGKTSVFVERDVTIFYRFAVIYGGTARPIEPSGNLFTGKTTFIPGISETIQLIIDLEEDPADFISDALAIAVNCSLTNLTAFCTIIDGRNSITGAEMRIEASYINESLNYESIANISFTGSSGTLEYNLTEINNSVWRVRTYLTYETSEALVWETIKRFDIDVIIEKNTGIFYAAIILIVVFALTVTLGPLSSGLIGFAALIPLSYLKIVDIPTGVITGLLALVIIFFFRTRKTTTE